jgi:arginine exporter protein ArgO
MCDTEAAGNVSFSFRQFEIFRQARTMSEMSRLARSENHERWWASEQQSFFLSFKNPRLALVGRFFIGRFVAKQTRSNAIFQMASHLVSPWIFDILKTVGYQILRQGFFRKNAIIRYKRGHETIFSNLTTWPSERKKIQNLFLSCSARFRVFPPN